MVRITSRKEHSIDTVAVIGYDPGFGNTKVCIDGRVGMIQSAVWPVQEKALDAPLKALDLLPQALLFSGADPR